jgi:peptidoglycan-associated lipoprotein
MHNLFFNPLGELNMFKKIVSISALALALAACETTSDHGMSDGTMSGSLVPGSYADFCASCGDRVFFATNSSHLTAEGKSVAQKQAQWLAQYGNPDCAVEGNCDERGTSEYNLALGERRAESVRKQLVAYGAPASSISTVSYGKERPAVEGHNEAAWAQNRRAVTVVNQ